MAGVARVQETPVAHLDLGAAGRARLARAQDEAGDAGDRRQGLATESVGGHALEVAQLAQLRGRVALQRATGILRSHAVAVVADADPLLAAPFDLDGDGRGLRVEGVLDQLLDDRGRPFHDLARRDLVDQVVGQPFDAVQIHCFLRNTHQRPPVTTIMISHTKR